MWVHSALVLSNGIGESLEHLRQLLLILRGPLVQNLPVNLASGVPHGFKLLSARGGGLDAVRSRIVCHLHRVQQSFGLHCGHLPTHGG